MRHPKRTAPDALVRIYAARKFAEPAVESAACALAAQVVSDGVNDVRE